MSKSNYYELYKCIKKDERFTTSDYKIYGLLNPVNNELFYIGCTKQSLYTRILQHINDVSYCNKKNKYITSLITNKEYPKIILMYTFEDRYTAKIIEQHLINFLSVNKFTVNLVNSINTISVSSKLHGK